MREIDTIIVHFTFTFADMDIDVPTVRKWHVVENGWDDIGYNDLIKRDGTIEPGRPHDISGAHARGHNKKSLGVALVGGRGVNCKSEFNFTAAQMASLEQYCLDNVFKYGIKHIKGHNEISPKGCPGFNVKEWAKTIGK